MRKATFLFGLMVILIVANFAGNAQVISYDDSWFDQGYTLKAESIERSLISYSLTRFAFDETDIDGELMNSISIPGVFLPGQEGVPDLPTDSRYLAVPAGAKVDVTILSLRTDTLSGVNIAPAMIIPAGTDDRPIQYVRNIEIYNTDAFYPGEVVITSEKTKIRGIDMVVFAINPFQYNPVSKELLIHRDMEIEIRFIGGSGNVGEERLRSRWWDPLIYNQVLNSQIIPEVDYNETFTTPERGEGYEYLIITPDHPDFLAWADSIKIFRTQQGIKTGIVTTAELGGNTVDNIKNYVDNAYNTWDIPPVAVLLLGDYCTETSGIVSKLYPHNISSYPDFASDNYYADVTGNNLPDIIFARITANNATQLQVMVSKFLNYERNPPADPDFYIKPITCMGWQTERWFQICSEVVAGFFNTAGKNTTRINDVYIGDPSVDPWSTASGTSTVLNYFGPGGLGYIPSTPKELGGFNGGSSTQIVDAINDGSFMILHRNHGGYASWGKPGFTTFNVTQLTNANNQLPYVFSINCQTGAYHRTSDCLAERFHRHVYNNQNSGALGVLAASEVSYSFVNDVYLWGVMDNLFPDFMPAQSTTFPSTFVLPGFAAAAGKYFLQQSSWAGSSSTKTITFRLFHHHGDAFMKLYTEVPQALTVSHPSSIQSSQTTLQVTADPGSFIALTTNNEILGNAAGTGSAITFTIPLQNSGTEILVTVTKQNRFRYSGIINVESGGPIAEFTADPKSLIAGAEVLFTDLSAGDPTSWNWLFPGGNPNMSVGKSPVVIYDTPGIYNVTLTASNSNGSNTITKDSYITVLSGLPVVDFTADITEIQAGETVVFTDQSCSLTETWSWSFPGGNPSSGNGQVHAVTYENAGSYTVTLIASNGAGSSLLTKTDFITVTMPAVTANFSAEPTTIIAGESVAFNDLSEGNPSSWAWSFPGGNPSTSNEQHPTVFYDNVGAYSVTLTVVNEGGEDSMTKTGFITVWDGQISYCEAGGLSWSSEWIAGVRVGTYINNSGAAGYTDFTSQIIHVESGETYTVLLTPGFYDKPRRQFWRVWIDYNQDGVFGDDEEVFSANGERSQVRGTILIPESASGYKRMRVAMKYNAAPSACETFPAGEVEDYTILINNSDPLPPEANFIGLPTSISTGESVQFTDASGNNPTSWLWSFPGGTPSSSTLKNPVVHYSSLGSHDVSLIASNDNGSDGKTKSSYIQVADDQLIADFTASKTTITVGEGISFTDLSEGSPTDWFWVFEGGTPETSTLQHPFISYNVAGVYNVSLTANNTSGSHTKTRTAYIAVTEAPAITYCESMGLSNALEWIAGVSIGSFSNFSGAAGYSDFTDQVISLAPGMTYNVALIPGFSGSSQREFWRIWIDFDGNGSFGDSGEIVFTANNQRDVVTGQITIPSNSFGTTRMRVSMKGGSSPSSCEIFSGGEVEDYTIDFGGTDFLPGITESEILVYPNPFNQFLNIVTDNKTAEVFMYGMDGKLLRNVIVKDHHMLDLGNLRKGMYMLRLVSDEHIQVKKIIKR